MPLCHSERAKRPKDPFFFGALPLSACGGKGDGSFASLRMTERDGRSGVDQGADALVE